jgi:hypothetical protein
MDNNLLLRLFRNYAHPKESRMSELHPIGLLQMEEEVLTEYNDAPHQGLDGLSPDECERRLMCVASG